LNDLRGFRHSYDFELDPELLLQNVERWQVYKTGLIKAMEQFRHYLFEKIV